MKKTRSTILHRAWPCSDFSDRASELTRSRSDKDYRLHKHYHPQYICQSPRGYMTSGDVSPISMSPISQSQFIPLGEVLCLAISAMNSSRKPVTQEALTEHLATCFPGVPIPTAEILHHTLSMLVRERKIYPTPEGYFIVTPQTYFITPSLIRTSSKWYHLDERLPDRKQQQQCTSPLSGTFPPSTSGCVRDRSYPKNHGYFYNDYHDNPPSHHTTLTRKSPKKHREAYSPHSPHTPTQPQHTMEKTRSTLSFPFKSDTLTKHREGGSSGEKQSKKFGLKLFRLSFKKDKTKQLTTFSAQFPPEEWPLQGEETPTAMPHNVEMEIIRRINPDLTVENVARHTAVIKRLEEERAQRSKASSSAQRSAHSRRSRRHRKPQGKPSCSHIKTRTTRGDHFEGSNLDMVAERDYQPYSSSSLEHSHARHLAHSNPNIMESHLPVTPEWDVSGELAKRRTEMPFPEPSHGPSHSKVYHSHTRERKSRNERSTNKAKERSRSMDNSKRPLGVGLIGLPDYFKHSPDERDRDKRRYYTDDGTLRAAAQASHYSHYAHSQATPHAVKLTSVCVPDRGRTLKKSKSRDHLPDYDRLKAYSPKPMAEDYFQSNASNKLIFTAPRPIGKHNQDRLPKVKVGCPYDRQTPHYPEYKEETTKGHNSVTLPMPCQMPEPLLNGHPVQHHNTNSGSMDRRKEIFSKDTLFKPPPNALPGTYGDGSYSRLSTLSKTQVMSSAEIPDSQGQFEQPGPLLAMPRPPSSSPSTGSCQASFDYYNVSDDDELEDSASAERSEQKAPEGCGGGGQGTMQWLLEREKERDLQGRFERNLTFPNPRESDRNNQGQQSAHSARLDSMDSNSVTVDSGFNSPRTRESLASNTSSIVESNRRPNLALSPGHLGIATGNGPPFTFQTILEPLTTQPEKLQKPSNCLASITSV
ncbi:storkhead-box protein 2 isoform X1 [Oncorhynchus kisutch]|uniref:Storkhead box 2 n=1 Tax=Oncorhynchus kisutch TaxID=8019 RepID=A0A8C7D653_ONCKI|nr:storkhead-box protein 2 isoform X1 [Oncorhynchus kisutch]